MASLTKHDITGAMLQAGVQSYFALNDAQDRIAQANTTIIQTPFMSFGTFSTYIQPKQVYGLTTAARLSGMMMDIDRLYGTAVDKDNKRENVVAFIASQGPRQSANEHLVPEALFDDPNSTEKEAEAISAVKALQIATQQGQKIFTVNQTNLGTVLPQLSHKATVMQDVKDAVAAGKIITISQRTVSYQGWTGTGYIVTDPNTGAGAYLIGGGMDGAIAYAIGLLVGALIVLTLLEFIVSGGAGLALTGSIAGALFPLIAGFLIVISIFLITIRNNEKAITCLRKGFFDGVGVASGIAGLQAGVESYFALNDAQDRIAQANTTIIQTPFMSFGTFSTYIQPKQVYGLTTAARLSGMMMDIDRLYGTAVDKDNKRENVVAFIASQGPRQSANEHLVPEALFDNPNSTEKEAEAISAVKALQIATQQGQKIFTINQTNLGTVLPQLSHKATVMQDVKDAVAAGKIVTISQRSVSYQGWTGTGYIVTDPNTGAGAYLIGGGMDGGIAKITDLDLNWLELLPRTLISQPTTTGLAQSALELQKAIEFTVGISKKWVECNREEIKNAALTIVAGVVLAIALAATIGSTIITGGATTTAGITIISALALVFTSSAQAAKPKNNNCKRDCTTANNYHFSSAYYISAGVKISNPQPDVHAFKEYITGSDKQNSRYDVCACKEDKSLILFNVKQCGSVPLHYDGFEYYPQHYYGFGEK